LPTSACAPRRPDKEEVIGQAGEKDVLFLKQQLIEAGKYRAVIDRCYPLMPEPVLGHFHAYQAIAAVVAIIMIEKNP
jgi:hypothetical protein